MPTVNNTVLYTKIFAKRIKLKCSYQDKIITISEEGKRKLGGNGYAHDIERDNLAATYLSPSSSSGVL